MPRPVLPRAASQEGQASVEFVALLPLLALVALLLWQAVVAAHTVWLSGSAVRAAARAAAVGADAQVAARAVLPRARVRVADDGVVSMTVPLRSVVGGAALGRYTARTRMEPQS